MPNFIGLNDFIDAALAENIAYETLQFEEIQVVKWTSSWDKLWSYCRIEQVILIDYDWLSNANKLTAQFNVPENILNANFLICRQLLTTYLKNDSLSPNILASLFDEGILVALLNRIKQLNV